MRLDEAIEAVKKDNAKVYEARDNCNDKHTIKFIELKGIRVDNCESIDFSLLPVFMQLNFQEVIDWSKVKVDARVIITTKSRNSSHCGRPVKRHFAKYCDSRIVTFDSGVTSWTDVDGNTTSWEPDEVTLAE